MGEILRATAKTGSASIIGLFFGVLTNKILAVYLGPSGIGLFSLLRQTEQTAHTLATCNGRTAIVNGIASPAWEAKPERYLATVLHFIAGGCVLVGLVLFLGASQIACWFAGRNQAELIPVIRWLSLPVVLNAGLIYLGSILNGYRAIGHLAVLQIVNSGISALLAYPTANLVSSGYLKAFIGLLSVSSGGALGFALYVSCEKGWLLPVLKQFKKGVDWQAANHFFRISLTTLITGMVEMGTLLAVRAIVAANYGLDRAGIFDVAWTLSMRYVTLLLSSFGTFYLPTLSRAEDIEEQRLLMFRYLRFSIITMTPLIISIVVFKPLVVEILYSRQFLSSCDIVRWMLIGDYLKITSWVFGMSILAFPDMKTFFWSELLTQIWFFGFAVLSVIVFDWIEGIGLGFLLLYLGHLAYTFYYNYSRGRVFLDKTTILLWGLGLILVSGASWDTWSDIILRWKTVLWWMAAGGGFAMVSYWQGRASAPRFLVK